jgi:hypothetical protein
LTGALEDILVKEHIFTDRRYYELQIYFLEWLRLRSQRQMNPGWEGYYVWFHRPIPAKGTDFGEIQRMIISEGHFTTLESIALHIIENWSQWEGDNALFTWHRYWIGLLANIEHLTSVLEQEIPGAEVACWLLLSQRLISDHAYFVPAGLFIGQRQTKLI